MKYSIRPYFKSKVFLITIATLFLAALAFGVWSGKYLFQDKTPPRPVKLVAFGDSLMAGHGIGKENAFPVHLENILREEGYDATVLNHGISGDTTVDALRRIDAVITEKPDIVIVEFGANDFLKQMSMYKAKENLLEIIETLKQNNITVLLAGLLPPVYIQASITIDPSEYYKEIASAAGVPLYPNFMTGVFDVSYDSSLLLPDKVHPSAKGAEVVAESIAPVVIELIDKLN